jgi:hypothetical protein
MPTYYRASGGGTKVKTLPPGAYTYEFHETLTNHLKEYSDDDTFVIYNIETDVYVEIKLIIFDDYSEIFNKDEVCYAIGKLHNKLYNLEKFDVFRIIDGVPYTIDPVLIGKDL